MLLNLRITSGNDLKTKLPQYSAKTMSSSLWTTEANGYLTFCVSVAFLYSVIFCFFNCDFREKLDAYHSVEALAMQVTKNLSLDKIKLRKPQGSELESVTLISEAVSPDEQLEQKDAAECIRRLIAQLPTLQQTIIRMKDIEGYELAEIAEITATPVENVRVNLSRARKKIREQFLQLNKQEKWT